MRRRRRQTETLLRPAWRDYLEALLIALLCASFVRTFLIQAMKVPSSSMSPGLVAGDHILVNKFLYAHLRGGEITAPRWLPMRDPRRGEVLVFGHPDEPRRRFVKRLIGRPGDTVEVDAGRVRIDGNPLAEPYLGPDAGEGASFEAQEVPAGSFFVLGDHRRSSSDSRSWGWLPADLVHGRAFLVYYSSAEPSHQDDEWSMIEQPLGWIAGSRLRRCLTWVR